MYLAYKEKSVINEICDLHQWYTLQHVILTMGQIDVVV